VQIAVVTFEAGYFARQYEMENKMHWPLLIDETRELYARYDMLHASFWDIWKPKTWLVYLQEILKGNMPKKSSGDISQRGGDVLIDSGGIVRLHHVGEGPTDRPAVEKILRVIKNKKH